MSVLATPISPESPSFPVSVFLFIAVMTLYVKNKIMIPKAKVNVIIMLIVGLISGIGELIKIVEPIKKDIIPPIPNIPNP